LAKHGDTQDKARSEAEQLLHGSDPTYEDVAQMSYITSVIREAMRILPPLLGFSRQATEDCIVNGYHVPKGTVFSMLSVALHNSPEYFEQPEQFKPERWLKESESDKMSAAPWYPFGAGKTKLNTIFDFCDGFAFNIIDWIWYTTSSSHTY